MDKTIHKTFPAEITLLRPACVGRKKHGAQTASASFFIDAPPPHAKSPSGRTGRYVACPLFLSSEPGFSKAHRDIKVRRIGFVASEITKHRDIAIRAPIGPYRQTRRAVRQMIEAVGGVAADFAETGARRMVALRGGIAALLGQGAAMWRIAIRGSGANRAHPAVTRNNKP